MASQQTPTPTPSAQPSQQQQQVPYHGTSPYVHNVALGVTPIALFAIFLPPRRLDMRLGVLGGVALWGTNQLVHDYSGTSTLHRVGKRIQAMSGTELPDKAKETQARIKAERARRAQQLQQQQQTAMAGSVVGLPERRLAEGQQQQQRLEQGGKEGEERGILERVWMGDSGEDWKEKRDKREKEALSEGGGGYWGLITDQISEVWSGGKKKDEGEKSSDGESKKS